MTTIAAPSTTITRELPSNQVSTMAAYPNPNYAMSPGADAIRAAVGRLGGGRPLYTSPAEIQAGAANPLLQNDATQAAAQPGGSGMDTLNTAFGDMMPNVANPSDPNASAYATELGYTEQPMGPTTQTAAGGIMGTPEFSAAQWQHFFDQQRGPAGAGGRYGSTMVPQGPGTIRTPPVMAGSRVGSSMAPQQPRSYT